MIDKDLKIKLAEHRAKKVPIKIYQKPKFKFDDNLFKEEPRKLQIEVKVKKVKVKIVKVKEEKVVKVEKEVKALNLCEKAKISRNVVEKGVVKIKKVKSLRFKKKKVELFTIAEENINTISVDSLEKASVLAEKEKKRIRRRKPKENQETERDELTRAENDDDIKSNIGE